jgi:hypothetical protein
VIIGGASQGRYTSNSGTDCHNQLFKKSVRVHDNLVLRKTMMEINKNVVVWTSQTIITETSSIGTERVQTGEIYLGCHIHVDTLVSWRILSESGGCGCDNQ